MSTILVLEISNLSSFDNLDIDSNELILVLAIDKVCKSLQYIRFLICAFVISASIRFNDVKFGIYLRKDNCVISIPDKSREVISSTSPLLISESGSFPRISFKTFLVSLSKPNLGASNKLISISIL